MSKEWNDILKKARLSKGLSLRQVAEKTGISNPYISQLENGRVNDPSFLKLARLLKFYHLGFNFFYFIMDISKKD